MKSLFIALFVVLTVTVCRFQTGSGDPGWPRWRGPNGDGISSETDWNPAALAAPNVLWKTFVGMGHSGVAARGGRLYTMGADSGEVRVRCLDADTGREIWKYGVPMHGGTETLSTPTLDGDSVYALATDGTLLCLNAGNGRLRWKTDLVKERGVLKPYYSFAGSPVVEGGLVILTANDHGLALNAKNGSTVWVSEQPGKLRYQFSNGTAYSTPVMHEHGGARQALICNSEGVRSVVAATGKVVWTFKWETPHQQRVTDPVLVGDRLFLTEYWNEDIECVLLDISGPEPRVVWKNSSVHSDVADAVVLDGHAYGCNGGPERGWPPPTLYCLSLETGAVMWQKEVEGKSVSLIAAAGRLITLDGKGTLRIARATPAGYEEISSCALPRPSPPLSQHITWTPPVLYRGRIYCRSMAGDLFCIDVRR